MKRGKRYERKVLDAVKAAAKGGCGPRVEREEQEDGEEKKERGRRGTRGQTGRRGRGGGEWQVCRRAETDAKRYIPDTKRSGRRWRRDERRGGRVGR